MRSVRTLLAAALLSALAAAPAQAEDPTFEASLSPERVTFGGPDPEARLVIETGADSERFTVRPFDAGGGFVNLDGRWEGSLLDANCSRPRFEGAGVLEETSCSVPGIPACTRTALRPIAHGILGGGTAYEVTVPARSRTTLVVPLMAAQSAPWPSSRYAAGFILEGGTLEADRKVSSAPTAPAGRTGVRIALRVDPAGGALCEPTPKVRGPVTVRGRTEPNLGGQEIVLRYGTAEEPDPRDLARVRVADDGTFAFAGWRPPPGYYEVGAKYTAQRAELADDFSSPVSFELTGDEPERVPPPPPPEQEPPREQQPPRQQEPPSGSPPPGPTTTPQKTGLPLAPMLVNRSLRADRGGLVRLRLFCPRKDACSGAIRVRIGGRTVARRGPVAVPAGARRTVRVRLSRTARQRIRRGRELAAVVRIGDGPPAAVTLRRRR